MHIHNQYQQQNSVLWCTLSQCQCDICHNLVGYEVYPIIDSPGWTFGSISVEPGEEFVYERCPQWDGTFIAMASSCFNVSEIRYSMFIDLDETKNYAYESIGLQICFNHDTCPIEKSQDRGFGSSGFIVTEDKKWYNEAIKGAVKGAAKGAVKTVAEEVLKNALTDGDCCLM